MINCRLHSSRKSSVRQGRVELLDAWVLLMTNQKAIQGRQRLQLLVLGSILLVQPVQSASSATAAVQQHQQQCDSNNQCSSSACEQIGNSQSCQTAHSLPGADSKQMTAVVPAVNSSCPSAVKAAVLTVPFILRVPTLCLECRETRGMQPSLPRKATKGLLLKGQVTKLSQLFSWRPKMPCTFSTLEAARS